MHHDSGTYRRSGRPSTQTYRRRRLTVVIALAVVAGLATWGFSAVGGGADPTGSPPAHQQPGAAAPSSRPSSPSPRPTPDATVTVTAIPEATVTVTATPRSLGKPCRKTAARLTVRTSKNAYGDGARPTFTVRVKPKKRCLLDPDKLGLVVTSGKDRIWSSRDCGEADRRTSHVATGTPYTLTTAWKRVRSNPATCGKTPATAPDGWYAVTAELGTNSSDEAVFHLE